MVLFSDNEIPEPEKIRAMREPHPRPVQPVFTHLIGLL
jgi:hypothetical protein